jgi:predicted Zn finger-like uncharacterized protein
MVSDAIIRRKRKLNCMNVACPACGAHYRVPDAAAGKQARCKKCGEKFAVAPPENSDILQLEAFGKVSEGQSQHREAVPVDGPADAIAIPMADYVPAIPEATGSMFLPIPQYLRAVAKSLLFPLKLGNLMIFLIAWVAVALQVFLSLASQIGAGCFLIIALLIVSGWYFSFLLRTVQCAAANEDELPEITLSGGFWEDVILPMLGSMLSWLTAALPFILGAIYLFALDQLGGSALAIQLAGVIVGQNYELAFNADFGGGPVLGSLIVVSLLLWPMFLLVVAVGGLSCVVRVDLLSVAIARSFPGYLVMSIIAVGAQLAGAFLMTALMPDIDPRNAQYPPLGLMIGLAGVQLYLSVIAMRAIGLYYHYFKHRLAWSWG